MESQKNSSIKDAAQATQESALQKTSDATHYVQDKVSVAALATADTVRSAVNSASDAAASTGTKASDTAVQAKDTTSDAVAVAAMKIRETYDAVKNSVTGTGSD